jgi:hypothetical protein
VGFIERYPPPGVILATGEFIEIVGVLGPPLCFAIAYSLGKWLGARDDRRVTMTIKGNQVRHFDARGYPVDEVSNLLSEVVSILAIQMSNDEKKGKN